MYGFQRVTGTATITSSVVAESRPSMNTRQKVVCAGGDVTLNRFQFTLVQIMNEEMPGRSEVNSYFIRPGTFVVEFGLLGGLGCLIVVFQWL
jgi:hypothetical protein